jgi:hypothetical protein
MIHLNLLKSSFFLATSLILLSSLSAQLYWDTNAVNPGTGETANGFWGDSEANWSQDSGGAVDTIAYSEGSDVVFAAGSELLSANVSVLSRQVISSLSFEEGAVTLNGADLVGDSESVNITVADAASVRLNTIGLFNADFDVQGSGVLHASAITGGSDMVKTGTGTAIFDRLDARLTVSQGSVIYTGSGAAKLKNVTVHSGASLILQGDAFDGGKRNLTVMSGGIVEWGAGLTQTISQLEGDGSIIGHRGSAIKVGGDNKSASFDGSILGGMDIYSIGAGSFTLSEASKVEFVVGENGLSNHLLGDPEQATRTQLNGTFFIDLSEADLTVGNAWLIVDVATLDESFGESFRMENFSESDGVWIYDGNGLLRFSEATGYLAVIPEPSFLSYWFACCGFCLAVARRRA